MYHRFPAICPDGIRRTVMVSSRQLRCFGHSLAATDSGCAMRARVQANGLSIWGQLTFNRLASEWRFTANSPAFMPQLGRNLAAMLLADVAARCLIACRAMADCRAAHDAALHRAARLAGIRLRAVRWAAPVDVPAGLYRAA